MARPLPSASVRSQGILEITEPKQGIYRGIFTPPADALPRNATNPEDFKKPIFEIDKIKDVIRFVPFKVYGIEPLLKRYKKLKLISIELEPYLKDYIPDAEDIAGMMEEIMPNGFTKDYNYGLGFRKVYNDIVYMLESFGIESLHIPLKGEPKLDMKEKKAVISIADLTFMIKKVNYITGRSQRVASMLKKDTTTSQFMDLLNGSPINKDNKDINQKLVEQIEKRSRLSTGQATIKEQEELIQTVRKNSQRIAVDQPAALVKLKNDIELVSLEDLITRFEGMLEKNLGEAKWQQFFSGNPLILNMAFNFPVIKFQEQAFVGGRRMSGTGDKVTDFLMKNTVTNNAGVIEIKKPATSLLNTRTYRSDVFFPSNELAAGINQVLDQVFRFQSEIGQLKLNSRRMDIEAFSVTGILVIGLLPTNENQQKSFELFRGNSKNIHIITFDELLLRLKTLYNLLGGTKKIQPVMHALELNNDTEDGLPF